MVKLVFFITLTGIWFSDPIFTFGNIPGDRLNFNWINISGFSQFGQDQKYFYISGLENEFINAGFTFFDSGFSVYSGLDYKTSDIELQAGHLKKINYSPLILNNGSYNGKNFSFPEKRPLGGSIIFGREKSSIQYSQYYYPALDQNFVEFSKSPVSILNYNFQYAISGIDIFCQAGFASLVGDKTKLFYQYAPFIHYNIFFPGYLFMEILYFHKISYLVQLGYKSNQFGINFVLFDIINEKYPVPEFYQQVNNYYFEIFSLPCNIKLFHRKEKINLRGEISYVNIGWYQYVNGESFLTGFYYLNESMVFSPYLAAYTNENFNVFIGSMGIRMGRNWMIAFLFSDNNTGQNYPLDPLAIPDEIYYEGLSRDSFMIFKNSYTGIQAFWSGNNIFIYSALLQNYGEFSGEHLVLLLRLSWHINF